MASNRLGVSALLTLCTHERRVEDPETKEVICSTCGFVLAWHQIVGTTDNPKPSSERSLYKRCPRCWRKAAVRDGVRLLRKGGVKQRFLCLACGRRFVQRPEHAKLTADMIAYVMRISGSTRARAARLQRQYGIKVSHFTIFHILKKGKK